MKHWLSICAVAMFVACGGGGGYTPYAQAPAPTQDLGCYGGAYQSGDGCFCPEGSTWDGAQCSTFVAAAATTCAPGAYWDGAQCMCPAGAVFDGAQCVCPGGTSWDGAQCVVAYDTGGGSDDWGNDDWGGGGGGGGGGGSGGGVTVTYERHASTDEIGKSCTSGTGWPDAGGCQYGAVCYHQRCTVWCNNDGTCASGMTCGRTDTSPATDLCQ